MRSSWWKHVVAFHSRNSFSTHPSLTDLTILQTPKSEHSLPNMAADDESSELSSLSSLSPAPSEDELEELSDATPSKTGSGILRFFPKLSELPPKEPSPPPRKRSPSPPHEYVLADNPDIAVRVPSCLLFRPRQLVFFPLPLRRVVALELLSRSWI